MHECRRLCLKPEGPADGPRPGRSLFNALRTLFVTDMGFVFDASRLAKRLEAGAFFHLLRGGRWTYRLVRPPAPSPAFEKGGHHMRRSHLTAAMVGIGLGMLGIIRDHGVAAQQPA